MPVSVSPERTAAEAKRAPYASPEFWAATSSHEYALHQLRYVTPEWLRQVRNAAGSVWTVLQRSAALAAHFNAADYADFGIPALAVDTLSQTLLGEPALFARCDFLESADGFKLIEINAETPYLWVEAHRENGRACDAAGAVDVNEGCADAVVRVMRSAAAEIGDGRMAVVCGNVHREDWFTGQYLAQLWSRALEREVTAVPVHRLRAFPDGLFADGKRLHAIHRCYPLEHFAADSGGPAFFDLLRARAFTMMNPGAALFLQSKALLAVIWGLYERATFFTADERRTIAAHFLPSYADLPMHGTWVCKPVLGREGAGIQIISDGVAVAQSGHRGYGTQPMLHQQYVETAPIEIGFSDGSHRHALPTVSCFLYGGQPGAVVVRAGGAIADAWAHFQPLAVDGSA